jgi:hypothetical protein
LIASSRVPSTSFIASTLLTMIHHNLLQLHAISHDLGDVLIERRSDRD